MEAKGHSEHRPLWIWIGLLIAAIGIGLSIYSITHHLQVRATGATDAACNINATFNCDEVALSQYAEPIAGIPLGVFGLGYFGAMAVLLGISLGSGKSAREHLQAYAVMVGIGVLTSLVLGGISLTMLGTLCLVCMGVYALCLAQGALLVVARGQLPRPFDLKSVLGGGTTAAITVAAVIAAFQYLKPKTEGKVTQANKPVPELAAKAEEIPIAKSAYSGLGEDYRKGGEDAKVVIQEFADFQCPACQRISASLTQLHQEYGDKILVVFRNYPLDSACNSSIKGGMHDLACKSAVMARCAGQIGKFWAYHDLVFGNQFEISEANLKTWATQVGLSADQINTCWSSADILAKIKDDVELGNRLGVDSTPTLFINGRKVLGGRDLDGLRAQIDQQLK